MGRTRRDEDAGERWAEETAAELYAADPAGFTALRDRRVSQARADGMAEAARRVKALRRPTLSAWAADLLVLRRPEETRGVLELGEAIRRAQHDLDPAGLRALSARQREVVAALSDLAARLAGEAGRPLPPAARREVESTLRAAIADEEAAGRWATGRLTAALTPPSELPATTGAGGGRAGRSRRPDGPGRRASGTARRAPRSRRDPEREAAERAERDLRGRRDEQESARAARDAARSARDAAREAVDEAEHRLTQARARARTAGEELRAADAALRDAGRAVDRAAEAARSVRGSGRTSR